MSKKTFADYEIDVPNRGGVNRYTQCPQCSHERRKNKHSKPLSVNVEKECWLCHHCGWKGGLAGGVDSRPNYKHWERPEFKTPTYKEEKAISDEAIAWFLKRGISQEVLERNHITTGLAYMPQDEDMVNTIQFPMYQNGEVVNIKYRDHHKHFRMYGGGKRIFYGLPDISPNMTVIVEGEMDKLALEMAGITYCISVPDGAPDPKSKDYTSKFDFMEHCKDELAACQYFVIAVDNDEPGKVLEKELIHRIGKHKCAVATWPTGCKDANDTLLKHGVDALITAVYDAKEFPVEGVIKIRDLTEEVLDLYDNGLNPGLTTGWENVDKYYRVSPGEWTLITGIPSSGKSEWLDALVVNLAKNHKWPTAIYSPENYPRSLHVSKLMQQYSNRPFAGPALSNKLMREEVAEYLEWLHQYFSFIGPKEGLADEAMKLDDILETTKELVLNDGVKAVIIDPWNEIDHTRPEHTTETDYTSHALSRVRNFARAHEIHVFLVAHPTKLQRLGNKQYPVPTPYDVSGSANWYNKADNAISVWRNLDPKHKDDPVQFHIQKVRNKKNGKRGIAHLEYEFATGNYKDSNKYDFEENAPF